MTNPDWTDDHLARLEIISALPGVVQLGAMVATAVEDALADAWDGDHRKYSCLHAVDEANTGNPGGGMLPIGWRKETRPDGVPLHEAPGTSALRPAGHPSVTVSCIESHLLQGGHEDDLSAHCFTCAGPIPEDEVIPVFAVISLRQPLTVYHGPDREFRYMGTLRTLPITYLCPRHAPMFDVEKPWVIHLPVPSTDGLTPEDVIDT